MYRKVDYSKVEKAIDDFWWKNHYPPTLRDIMAVCNISSTSACAYVIRRIEKVRVSKSGRIIPDWVDNLFNVY